MNSQNNYITMLWNLNRVPNIDWNKSVCSFVRGQSVLDLYLVNSEDTCVSCSYLGLKIKGSRIQKIKSVLNNGSYGEIIFHRREFICPICKRTKLETLPDLSVKRGISKALDMEILNALRNSSNTYQVLADKYNVSKTYILDLFDKYVDIKRHKIPNIISIDEIYAKRLTKTKYCCILYNPLEDVVIDVIDSRRINNLKEYFYHIPLEERNIAKYFISDLNETYRSVKKEFFKESIHAVDSFHVIQNLNSFIDDIRINVMKKYTDDKEYANSSYWLLKKFHKLLLKDFDEIENKEYNFRKFDMILDKHGLIGEILKCDDTLKEAYYLGQEYREFNKYCDYNNAFEEIDNQIDMFVKAKTEAMRMFGYLLINWRREIINSFIKVDGWRLSNGKMENCNRRIKLMFSNAFGYSNFPRTRNRIMFTRNLSEPLNNRIKPFTNKRVMKPRGEYKHHHIMTAYTTKKSGGAL